ncbi:hypothetical protein GCM10007242_44680 [Pigmentiphaga litoralis]|uniref:HK97-gp10 family putative phage morphogenesis protein n=1 Tax=Pigmentiphaga litoralis TaxID=516702 RepID=UPI001673460F|nr:HK97-gp10 family putative phage morphogenesis protein [Pigmentiphaga litoralis]GGX32790.1 hypothetical protein GCM10007242_44680 [Pigmentiphaga litoralis]
MAKGQGGNQVSITLEGDLKAQLEQFAENVRTEVLRPTVYAAARVLYDEVRIRVPVDEGTLYGAVYHWHSEKESTAGRVVYYVGVNKKKAPHWHLVEFGHYRTNELVRVNGRWMATTRRLETPVWVPAYPYIRPSYDAKIGAALQSALDRAGEKIEEIANGG